MLFSTWSLNYALPFDEHSPW